MSNAPVFATVGKTTAAIDVRLSYRIIELFSEGLYASPNKAIEELVTNSFDAGAQRVHVLLSPDMHATDATIVVVDDGEGMDKDGLKQHWLIGISRKRNLTALPRNRQQIGKFGIGKLATYVLAHRLTHISKKNGKYFSTSMDYDAIDQRRNKQVEPKAPIRIALRQLTEKEAKQAIAPWVESAAFTAGKMTLFGAHAPRCWTVAIMSSLKEKVHDIKPGFLEWVLRTALPLRDDFLVHLNGVLLQPTKSGKGRINTWVLGKDLTRLPKPAPKDIEARTDPNFPATNAAHFALHQPQLGLMRGYAEAYKDLLTGTKSEELGRSHGFFVYVRNRLVNVDDGHFGISPDELRHGTFGRFRLVIHIDGLDSELRSNRETLREGPVLATARDVLRGIFNAVRGAIEQHDAEEAPGAKLARKLAATPASISRRPIVDLARAVVGGHAHARYLSVPALRTESEREAYLVALERRASEEAGEFVTSRTLDFEGRPEDGFATFETVSGRLRINALHPFVATFYDEFAHHGSGHPLELLAMAEVLLEAQLHDAQVKRDQIEEVLVVRDRLLRVLADDSGHESAHSVANALTNARNNPAELEIKLCAAFRSLGFEVSPIGKNGKPDGVATAALSADDQGRPRRYAVSLEAKSKAKAEAKVTAKSVGVATIKRQRDDYHCDHAVVVGPAFPTDSGEQSALGKEIRTDRDETAATGRPRTITLITIDDLARLVRLRPMKNLGLQKLRELFQTCALPAESRRWIEALAATVVKKPPYRQIVETIHQLQKDFDRQPVEYGALRVKLASASPSIKYPTNEDLANLCGAMAAMAPGAISANGRTVELDQSPENVIAAIEAATKDYAAAR